jgi:hypothetical protein
MVLVVAPRSQWNGFDMEKGESKREKGEILFLFLLPFSFPLVF